MLDVFLGQRHALDRGRSGAAAVWAEAMASEAHHANLTAEKLFRSGRRDVRRK